MNNINWFEILTALIMSTLGGAAHMLTRLGNGEYKNKIQPVADMVMAGLAGMLAFSVCKYLNAPFWLMGFFVGIAGHAGVRAIKMAEEFWANKFGVKHRD